MLRAPPQEIKSKSSTQCCVGASHTLPEKVVREWTLIVRNGLFEVIW